MEIEITIFDNPKHLHHVEYRDGISKENIEEEKEGTCRILIVENQTQHIIIQC